LANGTRYTSELTAIYYLFIYYIFIISHVFIFTIHYLFGAWGGAVVKALRY
jgi:hypothetical protein